jgi:ribosome-associated protein
MQKVDFTLRGEFVQLCDLLKLAGVAESGGHGKTLVAAAEVRVDGVTEHRKTAKIRADQVVECGDVRIRVLRNPE